MSLPQQVYNMGLGLGLKMRLKSKTGSAEWTPAALGSDLKIWLKHNTGLLNEDDPAVFPSNSEQLTKWADQSGNDNHATADDGTTTDGFSYFTADGGYVSAAGTEQMILPQFNVAAGTAHSFWISFYLKTGTAINNSDIFLNDNDSTSSDFWRVQNTTSFRVKMAGNVATFTIDSSTPGTNSGTLETENWYVLGWERTTGNANTMYLNNVATNTVSKNGTFDFDRLMGGNGLIISGMVVVVGDVLTSDERTKMYEYQQKFQNAF